MNSYEESIDQAIETGKRVKKEYRDDCRCDFYNLGLLIKKMSLLSPAKAGNVGEKFVIDVFGGSKVPENEKRGDMLLDGQYYEIKVSSCDVKANFRHIRPKLQVDFFMCLSMPSLHEVQFFFLTREQMAEEGELMGAANWQGAVDSLSITLSLAPNSALLRWQQRYLNTDFGAKILARRFGVMEKPSPVGAISNPFYPDFFEE